MICSTIRNPQRKVRPASNIDSMRKENCGHPSLCGMTSAEITSKFCVIESQ